LEVGVHSYDLLNSFGKTLSLNPVVAQAILDSMVATLIPLRLGWTKAAPGNGEIYELYPIDGQGSWFLHFNPTGYHFSREKAESNATISGTAWELVLFLWSRIPASALNVSGNAGSVPRFFELVPSI
jgi:hypothetical protein